MDVSQIKGSASTPFSWGVNYQDTETEKFAVFLDDQDREPAPVRETRPRDEDDPYEKSDYADKDIDDRDDRDDFNASEATKSDRRTGGDEIVAAATPPILSTPKEGKLDATDAKAPLTEQASAAAAPVKETTSKTGNESVSPLSGIPNNSEKNSQGIIANNKENGIAAAATPQVAANAALAASIKEQGAVNKIASAETGSQKKTTTAETPPSATQVSNLANQKTPKVAPTVTKAPEGTQAAAPATQTVVAQESSSGKTLKAGETSFLEKIRGDESAKLTEKEALTSKISEMLRSSKGKITSVSTSNVSSAAKTPSLISGQNAVASSVIPGSVSPLTETAIGTITNATAQAEIPISMQPVLNSTVPGTQHAPLDSAPTGNSTPQGAAIPGVDSSSANSASQSASATRATMQAGSPAEQVSTQITSAVRSGLDQIKIQLNPAELGLVDIKLEIGPNGRVLATIAANNQESLDLLQQDSKTLEQALKDAGFETDSDSLNFSLNQQNDQQEGFKTANQGDCQTDAEQNEEQIESHQLQAYRSSSDSNLDIQV